MVRGLRCSVFYRKHYIKFWNTDIIQNAKKLDQVLKKSASLLHLLPHSQSPQNRGALPFVSFSPPCRSEALFLVELVSLKRTKSESVAFIIFVSHRTQLPVTSHRPSLTISPLLAALVNRFDLKYCKLVLFFITIINS